MKKYFILAAVATTFAACSFDKDMGESSSQVQEAPIPLTVAASFGEISDVKTNTRSGNIDYQSSSLINTNEIGLFIFKEGATAKTETYEVYNLRLTAPTKVSTSKYYSVTQSSSLYYPDVKTQKLDVYAYAPFISATSGSSVSVVPATWSNISSDKVTFYTKLDQTTDANYLASDVLWGCAGTGSNITTAVATAPAGPYETLKGTGLNQGNKNDISASAWQTAKTAYTSAALELGAYYVTSGTDARIRIPMLHRGSKIIVQLKTDASMDFTKLKNARVSFGIDYNCGKLDLTSGELATEGSASAQYVVLTSHLGTTDGTTDDPNAVYEVSSTQVGYQCAAVIIPQGTSTANTAGQQLMVELGDGTTSWTNGTYAYTPTTAPTFDAGKVYTYTITVKATGLDVVASVSDWVSGGTTVEDDATLQ